MHNALSVLPVAALIHLFIHTHTHTHTHTHMLLTLVVLTLFFLPNHLLQIQFNLSDFTRRAYGTNYVETLRVQIHANCRIR